MDKTFKPYDVAEEEWTETIHIVAFGKTVEGAPTYSPDDIGDARKLCEVLNAAYNAGAAGKGKSDGNRGKQMNPNWRPNQRALGAPDDEEPDGDVFGPVGGAD